MRHGTGLLLAVLLAGCAQMNSGLEQREPKSTAQLLNTYWKLAQLGEQVIATSPGVRVMHFVLHSENQRVAGFSGCNSMMGSYVLEGDEIKFAQMGGTLMACAANMALERQFLDMFGQVAGWEISGETLKLLDAAGKPLAVFEAAQVPVK